MSQEHPPFGRIGLHTPAWQWPTDPGAVTEVPAEIEHLGFGAVWIGASTSDLLLHERILEATTRLVVVSAVLNIWTEDVLTVARNRRRVVDAHPGRLLLGVGAGHHDSAASQGLRYERPLERLAAYLDRLDDIEDRVPSAERIVAALGPRALALAAERSAGAHPYLTTPAHTAQARDLLGAGPMLAPQQAVLHEPDPVTARRLGREAIAPYSQWPNYVKSWRRMGFDDDDVRQGGSDRLIDSLLGWGDDAAVAAAVRAHLDAGADHVPIQVLSHRNEGIPVQDWTLPLDDWGRTASSLGDLMQPVPAVDGGPSTTVE